MKLAALASLFACSTALAGTIVKNGCYDLSNETGSSSRICFGLGRGKGGAVMTLVAFTSIPAKDAVFVCKKAEKVQTTPTGAVVTIPQFSTKGNDIVLVGDEKGGKITFAGNTVQYAAANVSQDTLIAIFNGPECNAAKN